MLKSSLCCEGSFNLTGKYERGDKKRENREMMEEKGERGKDGGDRKKGLVSEIK